ncbi:PilZ domain-containing protein [Novosphingobium aquiterrae]|uniref:PilZ domain-containing protein n=1 Tax=Novosphingobium aquiterrae TaxID=624388 RepID=A0ABV6PGR6_9SPHN
MAVGKAKLQERLGNVGRPLTRRGERRAVNAEVMVESSHGMRTTARINDISTYGCNVQTSADWLRSGLFLSIHLTEEHTVQAIVRWVRDGSGGVEFLRPIPYAEAEALGAAWNG